jgi:hypothetical protein
MTAVREQLPNRRESKTFSFESMGTRFTASISRYPGGRFVCELRVKLPPCGRGLGPCKAVIETNAAGAVLLHCIKCGYIAPHPVKVNKDVV